MKAATYTRYGGPEVVQIIELPAPAPRPGELLIRVLATTVSSGDARLRAMRMPRGLGLPGRLAFGLTGPRKRVLGSELAGVVTAIGQGVTRFAPGDAVIGFPGVCMGAHAELCVMREDAAIIPRPAHLSDAQAAALAFGGTTALHFLRDKGALQPGERVLPDQLGRAFCRRPVRTGDRQHLCTAPDRRRPCPRGQRAQAWFGRRDACACA